MGLDCEHAFLPALIEASKNPRIQRDRSGYIDCSRGSFPSTYPNRPSTARATFIRTVTRTTCSIRRWPRRRSEISTTPSRRPTRSIRGSIARNRDAYLARLDARIAWWKKEAEPLKGVKFVSYHEHWPYFAARFFMVYFGTIELRPGIDPTPRHIEELIANMKAEHVSIVVREPQFPEKVPKRVAEQTGAALITLPIMPGGAAHTETYIKMMDYIVQTMVNAERKQ